MWTSALSGVVDVDVASLTAARLAGGAISVHVAGAAILLAITANTVTRAVLALSFGPLRYSLPLAGASILAGACGGAAFALR
jgi:uncharacterized membrane protein (DUF4010 family)